jgi:hypothetical protein
MIAPSEPTLQSPILLYGPQAWRPDGAYGRAGSPQRHRAFLSRVREEHPLDFTVSWYDGPPTRGQLSNAADLQEHERLLEKEIEALALG